MKKISWKWYAKINGPICDVTVRSGKGQNFENAPVIVTGLPRSGTSVLCNIISQMGYSLGPREWLKPGDRNNPEGYFECLPLQAINNEIFRQLNGDFNEALPELYYGWRRDFNWEKRSIRGIIKSGRIGLFKSNGLMVIGDLYGDMFPGAKWVHIQRKPEETYNSRFGQYIDFDQWIKLTEERKKIWERSQVSQQALHLSYEELRTDVMGAISKISNFLQCPINDVERKQLGEIFKPAQA
jgi:hypothetical protein